MNPLTTTTLPNATRHPWPVASVPPHHGACAPTLCPTLFVVPLRDLGLVADSAVALTVTMFTLMLLIAAVAAFGIQRLHVPA